MSLLVHELLIGTGGGGNGASGLQKSSNPVPLASVTVTHANPAVQVAHLQQSRVVTITSSQSRLTPSDKGSRLADALAGNAPYSYSYSNSSPQRFVQARVPNRQPVSHILSGSSIHSTAVAVEKPSKSLSSSRQSYVLPFVLQDHNYGAPPPATPPHSPPPSLPSSSIPSSLPYSYKVHQIYPSISSISKACNSSSSSPGKSPSQYGKVAPEQPMMTISSVGSVHLPTPTSIGSVATSPTATSSSPSGAVASQFMASMPLHRQQFMPHPKASSIYPAPSSNATCDGAIAQHPTTAPPAAGGQDTDEESRLSDRSSSVGPSGEETETAPEGEGEEQVQADDSITRCICNFTHDDGYMIQCDRCFVWQHVDCMEIDRNNIPDEYLCEACKPRLTDKSKARALQVRRRQEIRAHLSRVSSSDSDDNSTPSPPRSKSSNNSKSQDRRVSQDRKVLKKKKPKTCKENKSSRKQSVSCNRSSVLSVSLNNVKQLQSPDEKETVKGSATKSRRRQSGANLSSNEEGSSITYTMDHLRSWIEDYEVAVTNHYSPELRAKVHTARINGISAEFRESTQGALLGHRCRVAPCYNAGPDSVEDKILVAATRLAEGTAIIEYQGKYTLKSQWNLMQIPPGLPYLPFVLQFDMQKEGFSVCVDARTYGNDARFARRSSKSNAEIRHVVERGSVHLYIVAREEIEEEDEIILPLETAICQQAVPNKTANFAQLNHKETDNENVKEESTKLPSPNASQARKNGLLQNKKNLRKPLLALALPQPLNRTSRRSTLSESFSDEVANSTQEISQVKQRRASGPTKCPSKSPIKSPTKTPQTEDSSSGESPRHESPTEKLDVHKMTREERKIAAYMKAFERMEKAAQRRQEMEKRKGEDRTKRQSHTEDEGSADETLHPDGETKKGKRMKGSPHKRVSDYDDDNNGSSSEGERVKLQEGLPQGYGSPPSGGVSSSGFRFPKTKKALMNEWLNETINPVHHSPTFGGDMATGVPTCYMRSPSTSLRKGNSANAGTGNVVEMVGRSAKKRWLRQAIIDETEPHANGYAGCASPNSRPDSPTGGSDYITPLKKRRLARESMSSEQSNTPPTTPLHSGLEEKYSEEMEIDHISDENADSDGDKVKKEAKDECLKMESEIKKEGDVSKDFLSDQLTINISKIAVDIKAEPKVKEEVPEIDSTKFKIKCKTDENLNLSSEVDEQLDSCGGSKTGGCTPVKNKSAEVKPKYSDRKTRSITNKKSVSSKDVVKKKLLKSPALRDARKNNKTPPKSERMKTMKKSDKNRNTQRKRVELASSKKTKSKAKNANAGKREKAKDIFSQKVIKKEGVIESIKKEGVTESIKEGVTQSVTQKVTKKVDGPDSLTQKEIKKEGVTESVSSSSDSSNRVVLSHRDSDDGDSSTLKSNIASDAVENSTLKEKDSEICASDLSPPSREIELPIGKGPTTPKGTPPDTPIKEASKEAEQQHEVKSSDPGHVTYEKTGDSSIISNAPMTDTAPDIPDLKSTLSDDQQSEKINEETEEKQVASLVSQEKKQEASLVSQEKLEALPHLQGTQQEQEKEDSVEVEKQEQGEVDIDSASKSVSETKIQNDDSNIKAEEAPPISQSTNLSPMKPAAAKRKLSILEYRKRKSISCEREPKDANEKDDTASHSASVDETQDANETLTSRQTAAQWKEQSKIATPFVAQATDGLANRSLTIQSNIGVSSTKIEKGKLETAKDVKWNAAPTLLEQQRENLTDRLRRDFGLCLGDQKLTTDKGTTSIKDMWNDRERRFHFPGKASALGPFQNSLPLGVLKTPLIGSHGLVTPENKHQSISNDGKLQLNHSSIEKGGLSIQPDFEKITDSSPSQIIPLPKTKLSPFTAEELDVTADPAPVQCDFVSFKDPINVECKDKASS